MNGDIGERRHRIRMPGTDTASMRWCESRYIGQDISERVVRKEKRDEHTWLHIAKLAS